MCHKSRLTGDGTYCFNAG